MYSLLVTNISDVKGDYTEVFISRSKFLNRTANHLKLEIDEQNLSDLMFLKGPALLVTKDGFCHFGSITYIYDKDPKIFILKFKRSEKPEVSLNKIERYSHLFDLKAFDLKKLGWNVIDTSLEDARINMLSDTIEENSDQSGKIALKDQLLNIGRGPLFMVVLTIVSILIGALSLL